MRPADWIEPDWPAPRNVRALVTTRSGGRSVGPWTSMNLAAHVGDDEEAVRSNRRTLRAFVPSEPAWLDQVHGCTVVDAAGVHEPVQADASFANRPDVVCAVLTADCLPVLLCSRSGTTVAAVHAGWRGLAAGVIESTLTAMAEPPEGLMAWLGPAIGPDAFEVGEEVRECFCDVDARDARAFRPGMRAGKWQADLYLLARGRFERSGVTAVHGGGLCTHSDGGRFYSYRRDGITGRLASLVWLSSAVDA